MRHSPCSAANAILERSRLLDFCSPGWRPRGRGCRPEQSPVFHQTADSGDDTGETEVGEGDPEADADGRLGQGAVPQADYYPRPMAANPGDDAGAPSRAPHRDERMVRALLPCLGFSEPYLTSLTASQTQDDGRCVPVEASRCRMAILAGRIRLEFRKSGRWIAATGRRSPVGSDANVPSDGDRHDQR